MGYLPEYGYGSNPAINSVGLRFNERRELTEQWAVMLHKGVRARGSREEEIFSTRQQATEAMQWKQSTLTDEEKFQGWHYSVKLFASGHEDPVTKKAL